MCAPAVEYVTKGGGGGGYGGGGGGFRGGDRWAGRCTRLPAWLPGRALPPPPACCLNRQRRLHGAPLPPACC